MTPAEVAAITRAAQGLPPKVEDPAACDRVASLLLASEAREVGRSG